MSEPEDKLEPEFTDINSVIDIADEFPLADTYPIEGTNDVGARARGLWWSPYSS